MIFTVLQEISFPTLKYTDMYFRGGSYNGESIYLIAGARLSFDTYFGCFTYTKYRELTELTTLTFSCRIAGTATLQLMTFDGVRERVVSEGRAMGDEIYTAEVDITTLSKKAILYPVITAQSSIIFKWGRYECSLAPKEINAAIAICTYRREDYLKENLKVLSEARIPGINKIIVVDNGATVSETETDNDLVEVFPNKNYGGSAGFTRGIIEAERLGFSHVILMDDDIRIFPESLFRMTAFLSITKEEYKNAHVSAAMLPTSKPYMQYEKGARFNGTYIESFNQDIDVRTREALIKNLTDGRIEYGAWWCFCLPLSDVSEFGLPLPFFIKFDDVEYGTRTTKSAPIVTMSGLCVAHQDFDSKYNMHLEYYTVRNNLITNVLGGTGGRFSAILRLIKTSAKHLFLYRYSAMPIILRAFEDFLSGGEFLINTDAEALNRAIMQAAPKPTPLDDIVGYHPGLTEGFTQSKRSRLKNALELLTLGGHLIPTAMLDDEICAFPLTAEKARNAFMRKATIQYQPKEATGYLFKRNVKSFFRYFFECFKMMLRLLFTYGKAKRSYLKHKDYLTSKEFWKKYLEI